MGKKGGKKRKAADQSDEHSMEDSLTELRLQLAALEGELFEVKAVLEKTTSELNNVKTSNAILIEQMNENKYTSHVLNASQNDLEQYSRRNNIRIFGIKDQNPKESFQQTEKLVLSVLDTKLGIKVAPTDIDIAHRIGRFQRDGNRAVIVKFATRKCKYAAMSNRRKLKGSSIVIAEDLTATNYRRLQNIKELRCVTQAWASGGKLFAKRADGFIALVKSSVQINENIFNPVRGDFSQGPPRINTSTPRGNSVLMPGQSFNRERQGVQISFEESPLSQQQTGPSVSRAASSERDRPIPGTGTNGSPVTAVTTHPTSTASTPGKDQHDKIPD